MALVWIIVGIAVLLFLASLGRSRKRREAISGIRSHFPRIAQMRLVAACPALDGLLDETSLRMLFDWMLIEMHRRTGTSDLDELMRWSARHDEAEVSRLTADVAREAVDRLPQPVLMAIDECRGRTFAAVVLDEALTEAGQRAAPARKAAA